MEKSLAYLRNRMARIFFFFFFCLLQQRDRMVEDALEIGRGQIKIIL